MANNIINNNMCDTNQSQHSIWFVHVLLATAVVAISTHATESNISNDDDEKKNKLTKCDINKETSPFRATASTPNVQIYVDNFVDEMTQHIERSSSSSNSQRKRIISIWIIS